MLQKKQKKLFQIVRLFVLVVLITIIGVIAFQLVKHPELATPEGIRQLMSRNRLIAAIEMIGLYLLKGISFVFPSAALNVACGVMFPFPWSFVVSGIGIGLEFVLLYIVGRVLGGQIISELKQKYKAIEKLDAFQTQNSVFVSFIIRVIGLVSYDVGSLYLGASGVRFGAFFFGSMCGAFVNVLLAALYGKYMFDPFCWQVWGILVVRLMMILLAYLVKKKFSLDTCHDA